MASHCRYYGYNWTNSVLFLKSFVGVDNLMRIVFAVLFLAGCTASAPTYLPSAATSAELAAAQMLSKSVELPIVPKRSQADMLKMYEKAQRSIYPAALSICRKIGEIDKQRCLWSFELKKDEAINAYASGDNEITFYTGLIDNWVGYQEELTFVLAHEMAHHIANHIEEGTNRINTGVLIGGLIGAVLAQRTEDEEEQLEMLGDGVSYGSQIANLVYSVESEQEADLIALEILKLSDVNIDRARNVIVRMVRESEGSLRSSFIDTHPTGIERLVAFDQAAAKPKVYSLDIKAGDAGKLPKDGYVEASFDKAVGSYCVYVADGKKFPVPLTNGCPPFKYFKKN
jgi:Zn-dependent protease with chaperone function